MTNFIGEYLIDSNICDEIIEFHKNSPKKKGAVGYGKVDNDSKQSNDVPVELGEHPIFDRYINEHLRPCVLQYLKTYEWSSEKYHPPFDVVEGANIQHYPPGGGFKVWHFEQSFFADQGQETLGETPSINRIPSMALRHLVYMTYLNDVTDEGETEFFYQGRYVQPRKGLTLVWPAGWTHTHRGVSSKTQHKYIITGWISHVVKR